MTDATAPSSVNNDGTIYNHWQQSWMTDDPTKAQEAAEAQGLQVEWVHHPTQGLIMQTRYYKSAFEYVPLLDRNSKYFMHALSLQMLVWFEYYQPFFFGFSDIAFVAILLMIYSIPFFLFLFIYPHLHSHGY